ncbi:low temperature requirement protein A [Microterricola viridarii]|uniref:Low temperature requirement protein LtrA n=1 Tax=Microterricola viridarii TaxID=412690 RepID=A0A1H1MJB4_9MICO|nr:low temperature requirement protein A [Microterricola viridarii]SDR86816.1 Low temperature requirement protein LtrA [Microterricola viridarii]
MSAEPTPARVWASDRDPSRAHWMELFFDLIFVALVGQLAHGLHEHPSIAGLLTFLALFASVWWSWVNLTFAVNVMPWLTRRQLAGVMLASMFAIGAIAVAAPEATGERAWLFAAGNAALRLILLGLWSWQSWGSGTASRLRLLAYNGLTALLWFVSIWLPAPWNFVLWAAAILLEVVLLIATGARWSDRVLERLNVEHLAERFGLLVVIVFGESVLSIVGVLSDTWTLESGLTAAAALAAIALLAWSFFLYGTDAMRDGLEALHAAGDYRAIRDTAAFLPFLIVAGVTAISGAISAAILHPADPLPLASAVSLWGGIAVFYLCNAVVSLRFGRPVRGVLRWAVPALALTALLAVAATLLPAASIVYCTVAVLAYIVASTELGERRRGRALPVA